MPWVTLCFGSLYSLLPCPRGHCGLAWVVTSPFLPLLLLMAPLGRGGAMLPLLLLTPMTQRQG